MNRLYDVAAEALLDATLDLVGDALTVRMADTIPFDPTQANQSELTDWVLGAGPMGLTNCRITNRALCADPVPFTYSGSGEPFSFVTALIIYRELDGMLVAYIDTRPDLAPFSIEVASDLTFTWANDEVIVL